VSGAVLLAALELVVTTGFAVLLVEFAALDVLSPSSFMLPPQAVSSENNAIAMSTCSCLDTPLSMLLPEFMSRYLHFFITNGMGVAGFIDM